MWKAKNSPQLKLLNALVYFAKSVQICVKMN